MSTFEIIALVTATFLFGGFIKGTIGLGLPVVALAFMAPALGVKVAMAIMLGPCIITNIWQAFAGKSFMALLRRLWSFLLAASIGVWFGVNVLAASSGNLLLGLLGIVLAMYSLVSLLRPQIKPPGSKEVIMSPVFGGLGGIMFGMTGTFIVPGILYLQSLGLTRHVMVQALGMTFVSISLALAVAFQRHNLIPPNLALIALYAVVPTAAGLVIGTRYRHKISEDQFRRIFFISLLIVGIYMLVRAIV